MSRSLAFVGSLTHSVPHVPAVRGAGISVLALDPDRGALSLLSETGGTDNPSFIALHPRLPVLYATSERYDWNEGTIDAYRIDAGSGRLTYLNKQPTLGSVTAYASVTADGRFLLAANYRKGAGDELPGQSLAVFPLRDDGSVAPACAGVRHEGSGPVADRQDGPHPHAVLTSADGRFVIATDLGADTVLTYRFDAASGALDLASTLALPPGSGPRHLAWHPDRRTLYVNGELNNTVAALAWSGAALIRTHTAPTLPDSFTGVSHSADLHLSPDGRFVYCSNRGHDSIAVFSTEDGLRARGHTATGAIPRGFCLAGDGALLLVANQADDSLMVLPRDARSGQVGAPRATLRVGTPMCVRVWTAES